MGRPLPFNFDDFRRGPAPADDAPRPRSFSADDLAAARAEGVIEGRRLAMESIAADEAAALARIAMQVDEQRRRTEDFAASSREDVAAVARAFLEEFCIGLANARELEIAEDLFRRLIENSDDRRNAVLFLNAHSLDRLRPRIEAALGARNLAAFMTLEGDDSLAVGEARLEWRGGSARRTRAEISAAIAAIFETHMETEPQQ